MWEESGCERHISAALRRVYQLLSGQVDAVTPSMQASNQAGRQAGKHPLLESVIPRAHLLPESC